MIFLLTICCVHLLFLIKCLDHKLTCPCTQELQVLVFDHMQPSFSLLLLLHAKDLQRLQESNISELGAPLFQHCRCIVAPRGSLLPLPSRKLETLKGSISTLLLFFNYIPAWFWAIWRKPFIGFSFHELIATQPGSLALRWCQPSPPCTRYTAYKGNQNISLSERQQWIY